MLRQHNLQNPEGWAPCPLYPPMPTCNAPHPAESWCCHKVGIKPNLIADLWGPLPVPGISAWKLCALSPLPLRPAPWALEGGPGTSAGAARVTGGPFCSCRGWGGAGRWEHRPASRWLSPGPQTEETGLSGQPPAWATQLMRHRFRIGT